MGKSNTVGSAKESSERRRVIAEQSISLYGFSTGPQVSNTDPMGIGGFNSGIFAFIGLTPRRNAA